MADLEDDAMPDLDDEYVNEDYEDEIDLDHDYTEEDEEETTD